MGWDCIKIPALKDYSVRFLRTTEFTNDQWYEYMLAFDAVFSKSYSIEFLRAKYHGACLGYSFHGVLFYKEAIVGMYTAIPRTYSFFGEEVIIAQGCDAFIMPMHRKDETFLKQIFEIVVTNLKELNIFYHISIPNKTAYPYWRHYVGLNDIGELSYYIVPLNAGNIIHRWKILNYLSRPLFYLLAYVGPYFYPDKHSEYKQIALKRDASYFTERFGNYYEVRINRDKSGFVYLNYDEDGIHTAYLIDCFPLNRRCISKAIRQIISETGKQIDIIMFVGLIDNPPFYFIKVPKSKEPRSQPFIGYCVDNKNSDRFFNISNWEVSLANFDNR